MNKVIHIDPENPSAEVVNLAATILRDGGIVVFPTETVYGIGASATSCLGPQEIIDIKMRPKNKPLPWLVEDEAALDKYGVDAPEYAHRLAKAFWPGALTIVVKAADIVGTRVPGRPRCSGAALAGPRTRAGAHPRKRRSHHHHLGEHVRPARGRVVR